MLFRPDFRLIQPTQHILGDPNQITMIHQGSLFFSGLHGGELTKSLTRELMEIPEFQYDLEQAPGYEVVIDTRINMLMEGMYPSIPGWHGDWVKRGDDGQPMIPDGIDPNSRHWMILLGDDNSEISSTEFLASTLNVEVDPERVWSSVHEAVTPKHRRMKVPTGKWITFGSGAIHRATPATRNGWRFFFRASIIPVQPKNVIRRHVQSYVLTENCGW